MKKIISVLLMVAVIMGTACTFAYAYNIDNCAMEYVGEVKTGTTTLEFKEDSNKEYEFGYVSFTADEEGYYSFTAFDKYFENYEKMIILPEENGTDITKDKPDAFYSEVKAGDVDSDIYAYIVRLGEGEKISLFMRKGSDGENWLPYNFNAVYEGKTVDISYNEKHTNLIKGLDIKAKTSNDTTYLQLTRFPVTFTFSTGHAFSEKLGYYSYENTKLDGSDYDAVNNTETVFHWLDKDIPVVFKIHDIEEYVKIDYPAGFDADAVQYFCGYNYEIPQVTATLADGTKIDVINGQDAVINDRTYHICLSCNYKYDYVQYYVLAELEYESVAFGYSEEYSFRTASRFENFKMFMKLLVNYRPGNFIAIDPGIYTPLEYFFYLIYVTDKYLAYIMP